MYELSEAAAKDIENILERSVVDFGLARTELYISSLKNCLEILSENPGMGSIADDIQPDYRRFAHQSHVVFLPGLRAWHIDCSYSAQTDGHQQTYC
ncbi:MAG: type II toxin-antitoxin system RelE/ParE family toxin [Rhodothermia bacterium]